MSSYFQVFRSLTPSCIPNAEMRSTVQPMTNDNITLIRFNKDYPPAIPENKDKTISFDENIEEILDYWLSRI